MPDFELINQNGETITHQDYEDKIYIADFFLYAAAQSICIAMAYHMSELQDLVYKNDDDEFDVLVPFGNARDGQCCRLKSVRR